MKSFAILTPLILLFQKFTFNPDANSNARRTAFNVHKFSTVASLIHNVSSAYCNNDTGTPSLPTRKGLNLSISTAFRIKSSIPSATSRNRCGAKGSPCLSPRLILISSVGLPFTSTDILPEQIHILIQLLHFSQKLNLQRR
ncbi:hypothetical protein QL285_042568 [Trifolium repens]|nr:hypothetical protein QL285_042568 [Trifolium repens]